MSRAERAGIPGPEAARAVGERRRVRRLNVLAAVAIPACLAAAVFELGRALAGNELSWVYAFEWPLFAAFGVYMWRKLVHEQTPGHQVRTGRASGRQPRHPDPGAGADPQLAAWQEYLARLHAQEPPGGPPGGA
ncbi:hypothetical protein [Oryzihumus leptocrescens]|uniref:DNA-binding transcriptional regulator of glucitol operon n=1 Tax=Oryzihumus leptocrescens TaxID=297536 RepID=A0A542ZF58_9MICO|nr:hypothetical protein [Oryzihumus leptocrescens]TQL58982.1 hypothetical protein FB474_0325 [Oryzihumus leptocrescens]